MADTEVATDVAVGVDTHAVGVAFGLIALAAGFAVISALLPFIDRLNLFKFKIAESKVFLSTSLAFSAGVLTFFSLNHILGDAQEQLESSTNESVVDHAVTYTMTMFLGTIIVCFVVQFVVRAFFPKLAHAHHQEDSDSLAPQPQPAVEQEKDITSEVIQVEPRPPAASESHPQDSISKPVLTQEEKQHLLSGTIGITIAIALHNIPEGLLLFLATYESASIGVGIAFGLLFHKIPEGFVIAMPYYYSKNKALLGLALVLFAEVVCLFIGGLIGYGIIKNNPEQDTSMWGLLFAFAAGLLIFISIVSLLPRAQRLDPQDKTRSYAFFCGVAVIVISMIILSESGAD
jgi:ZIP family zinc transporter